MARARMAWLGIVLVVPGCVLDFSGLEGGGASGGGGTGTGTGAGAGAGVLCAAPCPDGGCLPLAETEDPQLPIARVASTDDGVAFSDPLGGHLGIVSEAGETEVTTPVAPHALTSHGDRLYFASQSQGIFRCSLPACDDIAELVPMGPDTFARQLAADAEQLFWIVGPDVSNASVFRCAVDSCTPELVAGDQTRPHGLTLDDENVYWTVHGNGGAPDGLVRRAPKDGGAVTDYATDLLAPSGLALAPNHLVFTQGSLEGAIWRCALGANDCGAPELVTDGPTPVDTPLQAPASVVVLGDRVIWTNDGDASVMACPLEGCSTDGGTPRIVARETLRPRGITRAGDCVAWSTEDGIYAVRP